MLKCVFGALITLRQAARRTYADDPQSLADYLEARKNSGTPRPIPINFALPRKALKLKLSTASPPWPLDLRILVSPSFRFIKEALS